MHPVPDAYKTWPKFREIPQPLNSLRIKNILIHADLIELGGRGGAHKEEQMKSGALYQNIMNPWRRDVIS